MNKDIIFYSNYDEYCKNLINKIKKNNIKDIIPICIDDSKIKIPSFIKVVPTLYLSKSKKILVDEEIDKFIEKRITDENKKLDILDGYTNISFSNGYHNIDLNNHNQDDNNLSIYFSDINNTKNEKLDEKKILENRVSDIDSLQKGRQNDISNIFN